MKYISLLIIILILTAWIPGCTLFRQELDLDAENPTDGLQQPITAAFSPSADHTWTIMIYMDGAVNLEAYALADFKELEHGLYLGARENPALLEYLNIIVLLDRISGYSTYPEEDWTDTRLYKILPSAEITADFESQEVFDPTADYGFALNIDDSVERNMADPATLRDFLDYTTARYPADHYALLVWNHGDGPRSVMENVSPVELPDRARSIAADEELPYLDLLSIQELQLALAGSALFSSEDKLDLIAFDACLMNSVEIAYEFRDLAGYMVGSMANEWLSGWDYTAMLGSMTDDSASPEAAGLAGLMVMAFRDSAAGRSSMQTLAALDLSCMESLKIAIDALAVNLYREDRQQEIESVRDISLAFYEPAVEYEVINWPYHDLNDFCYKIIDNAGYFSGELVAAAESVIQQLAESVVAAYAGETYGGYYGPGNLVKRGLFIVFPLGDRFREEEPPVSYYAYAGWYTDVLLQSLDEDGSYVGQLDFCTFNADGLVQTWTELLECWYDPGNLLVPWNTY